MFAYVVFAVVPVIRVLPRRFVQAVEHKELLEDMKAAAPYLDRLVSVEGGKTYACFDLEGSDIPTIHETLVNISLVLKKHSIPQKVEFDETYLKIMID